MFLIAGKFLLVVVRRSGIVHWVTGWRLVHGGWRLVHGVAGAWPRRDSRHVVVFGAGTSSCVQWDTRRGHVLGGPGVLRGAGSPRLGPWTYPAGRGPWAKCQGWAGANARLP